MNSRRGEVSQRVVNKVFGSRGGLQRFSREEVLQVGRGNLVAEECRKYFLRV